MADEKIIVGMADLKIEKAPNILVTSLGSCVGVCVYSQKDKVGGLLHFMLPQAPEQTRQGDKVEKYGDSGIKELFSKIAREYSLGPKDFKAKIFGGAKVLKNISKPIGQENIESAQKLLEEFHVPIIASRTAGEKGYKLIFDLDTGKVICQIFGEEPKEY